jgi:hypothetical protein
MCYQNDYAKNKRIEDLEAEVLRLTVELRGKQQSLESAGRLLDKARDDAEYWRNKYGIPR